MEYPARCVPDRPGACATLLAVRRRDRLGYAIYALATLMMFAVAFTRLSPALMFPYFPLRYPGITPAQIGAFASIYFYVYCALQPFTGVIVDTVKPRWTIFAASLFLAAGNFIVGFSKDLTVDYVGRAIAGIGGAAVYVPLLKIISLWFPKSKFNLMSNIFIASNGLISFIMTIPFRYLITWLNLRFDNDAFSIMFVAIAVYTVIMSILYVALARDSPAALGLPPVDPVLDSVDAGACGARRSLTRNNYDAIAASPVQADASPSPPAPEQGRDPGRAGAPDAADGPAGPAQTPAEAAPAEETGTTAALEATLATPGTPAADPPAAPQPGAPRYSFATSMRLMFRSRAAGQLFLLMATYFISFGSNFLMQATLGITWIASVTGDATQIPALIQGYMFLLGIPSAFLQNYLANTLGRKKAQLVTLVINIFVYGALALVSKYYRELWTFWVIYTVIGVFTSPGPAIAYTMLKESFPVELAGTAMGFYNLGPFLGSAAMQNIAPAIMGTQRSVYDRFAVLGWFLAGVNLIPLCLMCATTETHDLPARRRPAQRPRIQADAARTGTL